MAVTGIGGLFFRAQDPDALRQWYCKHLGVGCGEWGDWEQQAGTTLFSPFQADTEHFALDQMADGVAHGDVKLLDERGLFGRRTDHDVAQRGHRRLSATGETHGDELTFARDLQGGKNVRRFARG